MFNSTQDDREREISAIVGNPELIFNIRPQWEQVPLYLRWVAVESNPEIILRFPQTDPGSQMMAIRKDIRFVRYLDDIKSPELHLYAYATHGTKIFEHYNPPEWLQILALAQNPKAPVPTRNSPWLHWIAAADNNKKIMETFNTVDENIDHWMEYITATTKQVKRKTRKRN